MALHIIIQFPLWSPCRLGLLVAISSSGKVSTSLDWVTGKSDRFNDDDGDDDEDENGHQELKGEQQGKTGEGGRNSSSHMQSPGRQSDLLLVVQVKTTPGLY